MKTAVKVAQDSEEEDRKANEAQGKKSGVGPELDAQLTGLRD